jgi:hypothetical protein
VILALGLCFPVNHASAQGQYVVICTYTRCALGIEPTWNGLAVVEGAEQRRIANLNFFWPRDIRHAFGEAGGTGDSTLWHAKRAVHLRRVAAVLTDVGSILGGYAVVRAAANRRLSVSDRSVGIAGAAAFVIGVAFQFAADGALSRAVWWYNLGVTQAGTVRFGN